MDMEIDKTQLQNICADKLLSAKELFKYRRPLDKTVPNRGGAKDFAPDGSFIQAKWLEALSQERSRILSEQRVERQGSLVNGNWNKDLHLVELEREMGKFWTYMGFVDKSRKWLHPEEALFLMESNTLVVKYKGLPLSIQQAYAAFLGSVTTSTECYQVYAHLRRLGYVVLRHQGHIDVTKYERRIHLDQHARVDKKKRKHKGQQGVKSSDGSQGQKKVKLNGEEYIGKLVEKQECVADTECNSGMEMDTDNEAMNTSIDRDDKDRRLNRCLLPGDNEEIEQHFSHITELNNAPLPENNTNNFKSVQSGTNEKQVSDKVNVCQSILSDSPEVDWVVVTDSSDQTKSLTDVEVTNKADISTYDQSCRFDGRADSPVLYSLWDFESLCFPNIGGSSTVDVLQLQIPRSDLLPPGVDVSKADLTFNVKAYLSNQRNISKIKYGKKEESVEELDFSYAETMRKKRINAVNWGEFKRKMAAREMMDKSVLGSPAKHLWEGEVTPLLRPSEATSTGSILSRLQIIENVNLTMKRRSIKSADIPSNIVFDVFLPDAKFKKSQPGVPDYRVCVSRSSDSLPDLKQIVSTQSVYQDGVPVTWAVLDHGDIAFYQFSDVSLPMEVSMG